MRYRAVNVAIEERLLNVLTVALGVVWNVCGSVTERL